MGRAHVLARECSRTAFGVILSRGEEPPEVSKQKQQQTDTGRSRFIGAYQYAHMCRDGHVQIGHNDSGDDERCPVCRETDRADALERENAQMKRAILWALGEGEDFPSREKGQGAYWWRSELRGRAFGVIDLMQALKDSLAKGKSA
jgi:hypothetical protein